MVKCIQSTIPPQLFLLYCMTVCVCVCGEISLHTSDETSKLLVWALPPEEGLPSARGTCQNTCLWSTQVFHSEVLEAENHISPCNPASPAPAHVFLSPLPLLRGAQRLAVINPSFVLGQSDRPHCSLSQNIQEEDSDFFFAPPEKPLISSQRRCRAVTNVPLLIWTNGGGFRLWDTLAALRCYVVVVVVIRWTLTETENSL